MIKNKMALLGAVATFGMLGGGFVSPAQAIVYNVSGQLADSAPLTGSFDYTPNTYTNWNITIGGSSAFGATYNTTTSFLSTTGTPGIISSPSQLVLVLNGSNLLSNDYQYVRLVFNSALTGTPSETRTFVQGSFPIDASAIGSLTSAAGTFNNGGARVQESIDGAGSSVTAVPWETDALSVIGVTTLFGFGVWTKRKRKVDLSK
jgi:hypothetical protein